MLDDVDRLDRLESRLADAVRDELDAEVDADAEDTPPRKAGKKRRKGRKTPGSSRGIETLFRTAYDTQLGLTSLADAKANMLISVNGIILSIIIATIAPRLEDNTLLLLPTGIFLVGTLTAIVFAILAAQPRVRHARNDEPVTPERDRNLLFFGEFARRSEDDYVEAMLELVDDRGRIYDSMLRNIYGLGSVLRRKFRLLSIAYTSFMLALVLGALSSVLVYVAA